MSWPVNRPAFHRPNRTWNEAGRPYDCERIHCQLGETMGNALEMHDSRPGRPKGQTRRLAEEQRLRVYHLSLKGYSEGEIAQGLGINQSSVSRMLTLLRRRNAEWFQANKD